ncbi:MAG TPA: Flp pilus assembly protein CpaB [Pseudomonas sp.]|uniref:Flp pilus assembly protein CpaB n=1 Tax=Pseudomonas sp. TaxID=306 RepID=UPI002EDAA2D0
MKKNSLLLLVTAVFLAAGAALLVRSLLAPPKVTAPPPVVTVQAAGEVLVASKVLEPGDFIDSSQLTWQPVKDKPSRSRYFVRGQDNLEALFGATVRETIKAGEAIRIDKVVRRGEPGFLAAVLSPDMRAVSIPTSRVESNFGLVSPGDRVDVILGLQRDREKTGDQNKDAAPFLAAQTILRDVRVLALNNVTGIDQPPREDDEAAAKKDGTQAKPAKVVANFETVTLEVDPSQAERLAVAKEIGSLQLALRPLRHGENDQSYDQPSGVTTLSGTTDVFATSSTPAVAPKVMAFRGTKVEIIDPAQR